MARSNKSEINGVKKMAILGEIPSPSNMYVIVNAIDERASSPHGGGLGRARGGRGSTGPQFGSHVRGA